MISRGSFGGETDGRVRGMVVCCGVMCYNIVGFEALTAVVMKSSIFWDITSCRI
jgi:hypothetical protein